MSRETKFSGANGGMENFPCSADHEQDWQPYAVDLYSATCDYHNCIRIYCSVYPQLPPVIGARWGCCGHASGDFFPPSAMVRWVCNSRDSVLCARYSYFRMCFEKFERNYLTSYLYNAAILASFFFIRVFKGVLSSEFVD